MTKNSKTSLSDKLPQKRPMRKPWNDPDVKLELFIAPDLKLRIQALPSSARSREESEEE